MRLVALLLLLVATNAQAGDDASGTIRYRVDLGKAFTKYELTDSDRGWGRRLAARFGYSGKIVHFVRTSLPLEVDGRIVEGAVYQALETPACFYVAPGDAMLQTGAPHPISPGTGGLSLHAPRSRNFAVCLNCHCGGVPFLSGTPIKKGVVTWSGHDFKRF